MDEPSKKKKNANQCEMKNVYILTTVKIFEQKMKEQELFLKRTYYILLCSKGLNFEIFDKFLFYLKELVSNN